MAIRDCPAAAKCKTVLCRTLKTEQNSVSRRAQLVTFVYVRRMIKYAVKAVGISTLSHSQLLVELRKLALFS
jgi:hypothetical protein